MNRSSRTTLLTVALSAVAVVAAGCGSAKHTSVSGSPVAGGTTGTRSTSGASASGTTAQTTVRTTAQTTKKTGVSGIDECGWRSEERFAQVRGFVNGTTVTLFLQAAEKPAGAGEEAEPLDVPQCGADMTETARVFSADGGSSTPQEFVEVVADRSAFDRDEGFDIAFDAQGRITEVRGTA